jgi:hypothetical protein
MPADEASGVPNCAPAGTRIATVAAVTLDAYAAR